MTNAEYYAKVEELGLLGVNLVRIYGTDAGNYPVNLWEQFTALAKELEDYT
jgi:hypothetical protein